MGDQRGVSLPELLVLLAVIAIAAVVTSLYLYPIETPLDTGTTLVDGFLRQARLKAMATTSAYRVVPVGSEDLAAERASSCSDTAWTTDTDFDLGLPDGVTMDVTSWQVCFSSRGISATNVSIPLSHSDFGTMQVEVLLGGTTRIVQ